MNDAIWLRHRLLNWLQSLFLLLFMAAFLALVGWLLWGEQGVVSLSISLLLLLLLNPAIHPELLMRLYGARRLSREEAPGLWATLEELSRRAGLPRVPELWYLPSGIINAFSSGRREHAVVAVSQGLLEALEPRELAAVLAHEISHIRSDDTWVMGLADLFSRLTSVLSLFGQLLILVNLPLLLLHQVQIDWFVILLLVAAPTVTLLAQLGLSRTREFDADLNAVRLTGDPQALASALVKIDRYSGNYLEQLLWPGKGLPEPSWLRTHPPTEERVRRILSLSRRDHGSPASPPRETLHHFSPDEIREPRWHLHGLWF
jgi:heat shock protein HtpX